MTETTATSTAPSAAHRRAAGAHRLRRGMGHLLSGLPLGAVAVAGFAGE